MDSIVTGALQDRYELLSEIGRGGFGVVYKARQRTTQQLVAIKVLDLAAASDLATRSEQRNRFTREMELIAQLTSPHVVRLVDAGFSGDDPFMALEYLRGQELAEVIRKGPLEQELVKLLTNHILRALAEAHEHGIVHRDLKPQNIMLTGSGRRTSAKVLDFGIAGIQDSFKEDEENITKQGQIRGTPQYMAPEQFHFFMQPKPSMDVYSLGLVIFECLTGHAAIQVGPIAEMFEQHQNLPLPLPPKLRGSSWGGFLERACAKRPDERFSSADEMLEALHRLDYGYETTGPVVHELPVLDTTPGFWSCLTPSIRERPETPNDFGVGFTTEDKKDCSSVCQHVADCGLNTVDACLPFCAEATEAERSQIIGATCGELKTQQGQSQPAQGGSQGGSGTTSDCSSVGGSLIVGVCSGPPFPCRSLGCPSGWSCAVDGNCHNNQYPNCMRCP